MVWCLSGQVRQKNREWFFEWFLSRPYTPRRRESCHGLQFDCLRTIEKFEKDTFSSSDETFCGRWFHSCPSVSIGSGQIRVKSFSRQPNCDSAAEWQISDSHLKLPQPGPVVVKPYHEYYDVNQASELGETYLKLQQMGLFENWVPHSIHWYWHWYVSLYFIILQLTWPLM